MNKTLAEIADIVQGTLEGNPGIVISGLAEIQNAGKGDITFLGNPKYKKYIPFTNASAIIVREDFDEDFANLVRVKDPSLAFARLLNIFHPPPPRPEPFIHPTALISKSAIIHSRVYIGPFVTISPGVQIDSGAILHSHISIGQNCTLGKEVEIFPNVTIYRDCEIGDRVRIHSGSVIGSDGYGYARSEQGIEKIPQVGRVIIKEDVEIGANCTIDRGTLGETVIGKGTKLDNLIQIAHNVKIGQYCFLAAQTGVAGSSVLEDYVTCAGQVGIAGHLHVGKGAIIGAQAGVTRDVPSGKIYSGYPAKDHMQARREEAHLRSLPELKKRLKELEKTLKIIQENTE